MTVLNNILNGSTGKDSRDTINDTRSIVRGTLRDAMIFGAVAGLGGRVNTGQGASNTRSLSYATYKAGAPISRPRVLHMNWRLDTATQAEVDASAAATYQNWIEYPIGSDGTLYGPFTGTANAGAEAIVDCGSITIPRGASFRVWSECVGPLALQTQLRAPDPNDVIGAGIQFNSSTSTLPNPTGPGYALPARFAGLGYFPLVLDDTVYRSVLLVGDSHEQGFGDSLTVGNAFGPFERFYGDTIPLFNLSVQGDTLAKMLQSGNFTRRQRILQYFTDIDIGAAGGDVTAGANATTIIANLRSLAALVPAGKRKFTATEFPKTDSTDAWATVANQTPTSGEAVRQAINLFKRNLGASGSQAAIFDYCHDFERVIGVLKTTTNPNAVVWPAGGTADGIHGNDSSYSQFSRLPGTRLP